MKRGAVAVLSHLEVVQLQFDAFNRLDLDGFVALFSEGVRVYRPPAEDHAGLDISLIHPSDPPQTMWNRPPFRGLRRPISSLRADVRSA